MLVFNALSGELKFVSVLLVYSLTCRGHFFPLLLSSLLLISFSCFYYETHILPFLHSPSLLVAACAVCVSVSWTIRLYRTQPPRPATVNKGSSLFPPSVEEGWRRTKGHKLSRSNSKTTLIRFLQCNILLGHPEF